MVPNEFFDALDAYELHRASQRPDCLPALKSKLYRQQGGRCNDRLCRRRKRVDGLVCDYVLPLGSGGADDAENVQLLCRRCAALKNNGTTEDLEERYMDSSKNWVRRVMGKVFHGRTGAARWGSQV